jgi:rubrerythrin|tara:strand:- start:71 stop:187 length:117 start_codon:yes stop_codon:yes gene_type:complete
MTKWYVCVDCGYAHEGDEAPEHCPACGSFDFELETDND